LPLPLGRRLPSDRKLFESVKHYRNQEDHNCRCSDHSADDSSAEDSTSHSAWTGTVSLRGEPTLCSAALGICKCLMKPSSMQHCASRCPNGLGDVWYYEVFMDVENRPNEGRRLPRFRYREISRRAVVANLRKLDQYGVVTMFRMRLLLDLKKGPLQWKR